MSGRADGASSSQFDRGTLFPTDLRMIGSYQYVMAVGAPQFGDVYIILPNELLLHFDFETTDDDINGFMTNLTAQTPGIQDLTGETPSPAYKPALLEMKVRWIKVDDSRTLSEWTRELRYGSINHAQLIKHATPLFIPAYGDRRSASSLMYDSIVVVPEDEQAGSRVLETLVGLDDFLIEPGPDYQSPSTLHFRLAIPDDAEAPRVQQAQRDPVGYAHQCVADLNLIEGISIAEFDWLKLFATRMPSNPGPDTPPWDPSIDQWNLRRIRAAGAWNAHGHTGAGVRVAVIDDGFELTHASLAPAFEDMPQFNALQPATSDPMDAGPIQFSSETSAHGTLMAGIVGARQGLNAPANVLGVAPGCKIVPLKIGPKVFASYVANAINWLLDNHLTPDTKVISMSFSADATSALMIALSRAWNHGLVLCAAAGNDGDLAYQGVDFPARYVRVIAVGAVSLAEDAAGLENRRKEYGAQPDGELWESQFGGSLDVVAPGVNCWTTDEIGPRGNNANGGGAKDWNGVTYAASGDSSGDYFALATGTSAATPHVSGLAALIFSLNGDLSNAEVRSIIETNTEKLVDYPYEAKGHKPHGRWEPQTGYGLIRCDLALAATPPEV